MTTILDTIRRAWRNGKGQTPARRHPSRPQRRRASQTRFFEQIERRQMMAATPTGHMKVGMNLENIVDWSPAWTFTDAFQSSRGWITHGVNTATGQMTWNIGQTNPVAVDTNGNVTGLATFTNAAGQTIRQQAGTLMFREINGAYPAGTYRAEWEGTGRVTFGFDARVAASGRTAAGRNYADLAVTPSNGGIYLRIEETSPADPVRNFRVWMPTWQGQSFAGQRWQPGASFSPFHPLFRERLAPFGTIRFMQSQETNTSDIRTWADRRDANDIRQSSGIAGSWSEPMANGMSVEYMVQLANDLDADPWFNMPHMADDTFVRNFATYVRNNLEPGRKAYVEWSNEIWNFAPGFEATQWVAAQTRLPENAGLSHWQIAGREAKRDMDIWSDVFAGQTSRIVRVAAGQSGNDWVTARIADAMQGSFDAIAIAPYFSPTGQQRAAYTAATTVDQVLTDTRGAIDFAVRSVTTHQTLADTWSARLGRDVQLVAYEGGHHLDGRNAPYQNVFYAASQDPRMGDIYRDYLRRLDAAGLDLYVDFTFTGRGGPSPWGDFAKLHRMDQPLASSPLYNAVVEAANGSLWAGTAPRPVTPATVSVSVPDAVAAEAGANTGTIRLTRTGGNLAAPLVVAYAVGGTATAGADYASLSGTVTFPAGQTTVDLTIRPVDDTAVEPVETVAVTVLPGTGYAAGAASRGEVTITSDDQRPLPVLIVIANDDFYYAEYAAPRAALEAAGIPVVIGAGRRALSVPHANTGAPSGNGAVMPDIALADARAADYSAVLFVGGHGAAQYQYAFPGRYANPAYNGSLAIREAANRLINEFVVQGKVVSGVCFGVSVLAWSRVNGQSLLQGRTATTAQLNSPANNVPNATLFRWHLETNGATAFTGGALGDVNSRADDVLVDGRIVTGDNFDSARLLGETLADRLLRRNQPVVSLSATDPRAAEANRDIGVLTATRTGRATAALAVNYSLSGTATNGADYDALRGTVVIHPGQTTASIIVRPVADTQVEPAETVVATLAGSSAYGAGSSTSGTVTIADAAARQMVFAALGDSGSDATTPRRGNAIPGGARITRV